MIEDCLEKSSRRRKMWQKAVITGKHLVRGEEECDRTATNEENLKRGQFGIHWRRSVIQRDEVRSRRQR